MPTVNVSTAALRGTAHLLHCRGPCARKAAELAAWWRMGAWGRLAKQSMAMMHHLLIRHHLIQMIILTCACKPAGWRGTSCLACQYLPVMFARGSPAPPFTFQQGVHPHSVVRGTQIHCLVIFQDVAHHIDGRLPPRILHTLAPSEFVQETFVSHRN